MESFEERFWSKVDQYTPFGPKGDCWEWKGAKQKTGYGRFGVAGKTLIASRLSYELTFGPPKDGMHIRHTCDNPSCVNPSHLLEGTVLDNARDKTERGRHNNQKKTHCKRGHELSGENLIQNPKQRVCRTCFYESRKKSDRKRADAKRVSKT